MKETNPKQLAETLEELYGRSADSLSVICLLDNFVRDRLRRGLAYCNSEEKPTIAVAVHETLEYSSDVDTDWKAPSIGGGGD